MKAAPNTAAQRNPALRGAAIQPSPFDRARPRQSVEPHGHVLTRRPTADTATKYAMFSVRIKGVADRERRGARALAGEGGCRLRNQEPEASHELQVDGPTVLGTPGVGCPSDRDGGGLA